MFQLEEQHTKEMSASVSGEPVAATSSVDSDRIIMKTLFDSDVGVVKVGEGVGSGLITQCAQFPIASFDRKNKGLTSIIENLKVRNLKGELRRKYTVLAATGETRYSYNGEDAI